MLRNVQVTARHIIACSVLFPVCFVKYHIVESAQQTFHVLKLRICVDTLSFFV